MALINANLGTTDTDIFTAVQETALTVVYFCNTGISAITIQVHAVPNGDVVNNSNKIYHDLEIPAGDTYILETERMIFETGDKMTASASAAATVAATVSYKVI